MGQRAGAIAQAGGVGSGARPLFACGHHCLAGLIGAQQCCAASFCRGVYCQFQFGVASVGYCRVFGLAGVAETRKGASLACGFGLETCGFVSRCTFFLVGAAGVGTGGRKPGLNRGIARISKQCTAVVSERTMVTAQTVAPLRHFLSLGLELA
ncbi:MAG: hypothetical protein JO122_00200 [Acetobacteraceae bacterium]|nr:hypothetical protein [Acetobacteraceae bacterium]